MSQAGLHRGRNNTGVVSAEIQPQAKPMGALEQEGSHRSVLGLLYPVKVSTDCGFPTQHEGGYVGEKGHCELGTPAQ